MSNQRRYFLSTNPYEFGFAFVHDPSDGMEETEDRIDVDNELEHMSDVRRMEPKSKYHEITEEEYDYIQDAPDRDFHMNEASEVRMQRGDEYLLKRGYKLEFDKEDE